MPPTAENVEGDFAGHTGCDPTHRAAPILEALRHGQAITTRVVAISANRDQGLETDCCYTACSALVLAVEAAEALHVTSPTVTSGLTAAVRPIERPALQEQ